MLKMIGRLKTHYLRLHLQGKTITLLFATVLMAMGLQLTLHAGTSQFLFDMAAIKDPGSLAVKLEDTRAPVSQWIASQVSEDGQRLLAGYDGISDPSPKLQQALLSDLNRLLQAGPLYDAQVFADIELSEETQALIAQNPKDGEALVRLNRWLLADAYPYELASLSAQQDSEDFKGIETCRENLRLIKLAREKYWIANAGADPEWLSELSPEYLEEKVLLCPADATAGVPGVLTEGGADPTLPCSYLYELRPSEKTGQVNLLLQEGDMLPIVRCERHLLNLSAGGKIYRSGPQRGIYTSNKTGFSVLNDFMQELRTQHGEAFLKTQKGRQELKQATEKLIIKQLVPAFLNAFEKEAYTQLEAQLGKNILNTAMGMDILKQATGQIRDQVKSQLQSQLEAHLSAEFLKTEEGQDILKQLSGQIDVFSLDGR